MKAVILSGGLGKRLRPLTFSIPKPLLPIGGKPILEIIIRQLRRHGFNEIVLMVSYRADLIRAYFRNGSSLKIKIDYLPDDRSLGNAGTLPMLLKRFEFKKDECFLLMNCDILTKLNFNQMVKFHKLQKAMITVGVKNIQQKFQFGLIDRTRNHIREIVEKPIFRYDVSTGIYVIESQILKIVPPNTFLNMPDLINMAVQKRKIVAAYNIIEEWLAVDYLDQFNHVNRARCKYI